MCYDDAAKSSYCALKEEHCASSETYYSPHSGAMSGTDCNCDDVHLGGCMDGTSFSHCAVAVDNCKAGQTHLAPRALREAVPDVDCRLCRNSWDENPPVASPRAKPVTTPVTTPVASPVASPVETKTLTATDDDDKKSNDDDDKKVSDDDDNSSAGSFESLVSAFVAVSFFSLLLS